MGGLNSQILQTQFLNDIKYFYQVFPYLVRHFPCRAYQRGELSGFGDRSEYLSKHYWRFIRTWLDTFCRTLTHFYDNRPIASFSKRKHMEVFWCDRSYCLWWLLSILVRGNKYRFAEYVHSSLSREHNGTAASVRPSFIWDMSNAYQNIVSKWTISVCIAFNFLLNINCDAQGKFMPNYIEVSGYIEACDCRTTLLTAMDIGKLLYISNKVYFSPEVDVYKFWDVDYSSIGLGVRPAFKFYLLNSSKYNLFTDVKGGIMYMLPEYPSTAVNFTFLLGMGSDIFISKKYRTSLSVRYTHFSNGKKNGERNNPTWDGFGCCIGWTFDKINSTDKRSSLKRRGTN